MKSKIETINITPTWAGLMPAFFAILEDGKNEGQVTVREELMKLAKTVDEWNRQARATLAVGGISDDDTLDLINALKVFTLDKNIHNWLKQNDPKALEQAQAALTQVSRR